MQNDVHKTVSTALITLLTYTSTHREKWKDRKKEQRTLMINIHITQDEPKNEYKTRIIRKEAIKH